MPRYAQHRFVGSAPAEVQLSTVPGELHAIIHESNKGGHAPMYALVERRAEDNISLAAVTTVSGDSNHIHITAPNHGLKEGDVIEISGTTSYNGKHIVTHVSAAASFQIRHTYVSSQTGTINRGFETIASHTVSGRQLIDMRIPFDHLWFVPGEWDSEIRVNAVLYFGSP